MRFDRQQFARAADGIAVALAASLPWSTSVTGILAAMLLVTLIPTLDPPWLRRVLVTPAGGLPALLVALGVAGVFWADVSWPERFAGVSSFFKLLFIPLLLHHFGRSDRGRHVLIGYVASCAVLLIVSWTLMVWPSMPWPVAIRAHGIPVKDYVSQSAMLTIFAFVVMQFAHDAWREGRRWLALALLLVMLASIANIFYIATSRTSLVVIPVLMLVFGFRLFGWKGAAALVAGCILLAAAAWPSATFMRLRVTSFFDEMHSYRIGAGPTSAGQRLEFWQQSAGFIMTAPVIGHGTGTITEQFRRADAGRSGLGASANPHNQIFAVGIQLGLAGIAVLLAMWIAHLAMFRSGSFTASVGLIVVIQNVVSSLFNSHLFDFTQGWAYVIGVGIAGGTMLRERSLPPRSAAVVGEAVDGSARS